MYATSPFGLHTGIGVGTVWLGVLVRLWSAVHMGPDGRSREPKVKKLVYTGPYELTRNPLYIANIAIYTGVGIAAVGPVGGVAMLMASCGYYAAIVRFEEDFLEHRLGEIYRSYRNRVPRWVGEAAPVHAAAPKGILAERANAAMRSERATMMLCGIVTLLVLFRSVSAG
jgi:protein-S-isoprenylcysteine O-methyltransferase Ste14